MLPRPPGRAVAVAAVAIVAVAALAMALGDGPGSPSAPAREAVGPAPRVAVKPLTRPHRAEPRSDWKPEAKRRPRGQLDGRGGGEPKRPAPTAYEQAAPGPELAPAPEPPPITGPAPAPIAEPSPPAPAPTPPAAEFGM